MERTLQTIERRVLEDMWIGASARRTVAAAVAVLCVVAIAVWRHTRLLGNESVPNDVVPKVAAAAFFLAAATSLLALCRKRFRWCCAAAVLTGKSAATGFGALWWYHTVPNPEPSWWTLLGCVGATSMVVAWLSVILTPLNLSQPDMRARVVAAD